MKNFLAGFAIGLPLGMLLADIVTPETRSPMAEHMRAIWTDARARAEQLKSSGKIPQQENPTESSRAGHIYRVTM